MSSNLKLTNINGKALEIVNSDTNLTDITIDGGQIMTQEDIAYADNATAIAGGLVVGMYYSTSTGEVRKVV